MYQSLQDDCETFKSVLSVFACPLQVPVDASNGWLRRFRLSC